MKRIILLLFIFAIVFPSCKKAYTCDCTVTEKRTDDATGDAETFVHKNNTSVYSEKMTEAQALSACDHEETGIQSNFDALMTDSTNSPNPNFVFSTDCKIK
jgi:hypothetical protein